MPHYTYRNVNSAFRGMLEEIQSDKPGVFSRTPSRNGDVIRWRRPVIIEYERPTERVLFNASRDASPAFHVYEALWMLAGRNDLAPLQYYVSDFGNYSDDGETLNGAYGYRWRHAKGNGMYHLDADDGYKQKPCEGSEYNQLSIIIDHLKHNPTSRRAVLHMSNVKDDLLKMDTTKDQCCNLSVVFEIEKPSESEGQIAEQGETPASLNMTVYNRSNDMIYGALGANVVHFSFLQEYMAACIGVEVGTYCQVSSNMHVYTDPSKYRPEKWLAYDSVKSGDGGYEYAGNLWRPFPLVKDPATFDREVQSFVGNAYGEGILETVYNRTWEEPFLQHVARPMVTAFAHHKHRDYGDAMNAVGHIKADDWRLVARNWILKRKSLWEKKNEVQNRQGQES